MTDERRIYVVATDYEPRIKVYAVVKETPGLFKVKPLVKWAYVGQIRKSDPSVFHSLDAARACITERLERRIEGLEQQIAEAEQQLAQVDQLQPEWREGVEHE